MFIESTGFASRKIGGNAVELMLQDGCIEVRTGPQPVNADAAVTGTLIGIITRDGGVFTPGSPANGLRWVRDGRYVAKDPSHTWMLKGLGAGVAGWFRLKANALDGNGISDTLVRCDGAIGLVGGSGDIQFFMPVSANIAADTLIKINNWWYAVPPLPGE